MSSRSLTWLQKAKSVSQMLFGFICVIFFYRWLSSNWLIVRSIWSDMNWLLVVGSFLFLSIGSLLLPSGMIIFMRSQNIRLGYVQSAQAYYGSQLAKYLPGGIWIYPSRLIIMRNIGLDWGISTLAFAFENISLVLSSLLVSLVALGSTIARIWSIEFQLLVALAATVTVGSIILPELIQLVSGNAYQLPETLQRVKTIPIVVRARSLVISVLIYSVMWLMTGISFYLLIVSMSASISISSIPVTIGVFSFAWLAGFISILAPGGIGVREGVIAVMLGSILPSPYPAVGAIFSRVLWSIAEMMFLAFSVLSGKCFGRDRKSASLKTSRMGGRQL